MTIDELRREIDSIDDELLDLFQRRMAAAKQIGQYKKENSLAVKDSEREQKILSRLCEKAQPELAEYVKALFVSLIEMSRDYQKSRNGVDDD